MKITLDKGLITRAQRYSAERASATRKVIRYFSVLTGPILIVGMHALYIVGPMFDIIEAPTAGDWTVLGILVLMVLSFEFPKLMAQKKLRNMGLVYLDVDYSNEGIEIERDNHTERREWNDYTGWFEKEGLLLLYRRKKFLGPMAIVFDLIDLNQISEEEKSSFMEMLRKKVDLL